MQPHVSRVPSETREVYWLIRTARLPLVCAAFAITRYQSRPRQAPGRTCVHRQRCGHAQVGESEASRLYASGAGHIGGSHDAPTDGQGSGATIQILRSIDGRSAQLDRGAPFPALHYKKGRPIDHSILTACAAVPLHLADMPRQQCIHRMHSLSRRILN